MSRILNAKAELPFERLEEVAQILRLDKVSQDRIAILDLAASKSFSPEPVWLARKLRTYHALMMKQALKVLQDEHG